jgi:hypothetical protein
VRQDVGTAFAKCLHASVRKLQFLQRNSRVAACWLGQLAANCSLADQLVAARSFPEASGTGAGMFGVTGSEQGGDFVVQGGVQENIKFRHVANQGVQAQPSVVVCDGRAGDGSLCGAEAQVRRVHYRHTARLNRRLGEVQQVLSEVEYEINCPRCGWRTQLERPGSN